MFEVETLFLICIMLLPIVTGAYTFYKSFKVVEKMFEVVILLLYFGYLAFLSIAMHFHIVEVLR